MKTILVKFITAIYKVPGFKKLIVETVLELLRHLSSHTDNTLDDKLVAKVETALKPKESV